MFLQEAVEKWAAVAACQPVTDVNDRLVDNSLTIAKTCDCLCVCVW